MPDAWRFLLYKPQEIAGLCCVHVRRQDQRGLRLGRKMLMLLLLLRACRRLGVELGKDLSRQILP
jgi:hypothetical protein